ncbi:hypothetical protein B566_EDAN008928 [Ephemera danica]|nr:hypothetical protein B566_EDAN008928 [Ephemera danica]
MHALASLICSQVLEDVACPSQSMRCCVDNVPGNVTSSEHGQLRQRIRVLRQHQRAPPPPPRPASTSTATNSVDTVLNTLSTLEEALGLFTAATPSKPPPTRAPPRTTTTTPPPPPDNRPECPGSRLNRRIRSSVNAVGPVPSATPPPPSYSKYVCGVKGTQREAAMEPSRRRRETNSTQFCSMLIENAEIAQTWREGRVVGGADADPGEWCWQVALINSMNQYLCGGALIGTQWVLTAAHCVTNIVRSGDAIYVRVGDHDLTRKYGSPGAQTLRVATTYIHHNHNSQTLDNDVALLKLHGQAELTEAGVCLVCLPARGAGHPPGKRCTVTGYGYMGEAGPIPLRIREAEIPIVSDAECLRKINAVTEKIFILPASSFCAGGEEGNDACQLVN